MPQLRPSDNRAGKQYYEPILTKIVATSQYRDDQFRLEGLEGYWQQGRDVMLPPHDTVAWFSLATKPKGGGSTPGSLYRDITKCVQATEQDKRDYAESAQAAPSDWGGPQAPEAGSNASPANLAQAAPVEQRILQGMFFNNLTVALAAGKTAPIQMGLAHLADQTGKDPAMVWGELAAAAAAGDPLPLLMPSFKDEPEPEEAQSGMAVNAEQEPPEEEEELPW